MKTRTKVALAAPVVAGLVGSLGLGTVLRAVPPAHADSTFAHYGYEGDYNAWAYRDELRYVGLLHEDICNARSLSARLCGERAEGYTEYPVARHLDQSPDGYTIATEVSSVYPGRRGCACACRGNHTFNPRVVKQIVKRIAPDGDHRDVDCLRTLAYGYYLHGVQGRAV